MKPEVKTQWVKDLRSGEFPQATSHLRKQGGGYCCLGVLANQFATKWEATCMIDRYRLVPYRDGECLANGAHSAWLSEEFMKEVGLNRDLANELATMNDHEQSFHAIADVIDAKVT